MEEERDFRNADSIHFSRASGLHETRTRKLLSESRRKMAKENHCYSYTSTNIRSINKLSAPLLFTPFHYLLINNL